MVHTGIRRETDSWLAPALLVAGVIAVGYGMMFHAPGSQDMNPGVEGAVTVGVFAPMLLLLHGLGFTEMLKVVVPIWALQLVATAAVSGPIASSLGINLCTTGAIGILGRVIASYMAPQIVVAPARAPRREARLQTFARAA
jgi:hypothetical protein